MHKLSKNFLSTSAANIMGQLIGFISLTYYSNMLGEYNYGVITYAQQYILYLTTIVLFGVQTFGTKLIVNKEKDEGILLNELSSFRLIIAILSCVICMIISIVLFKNITLSIILILWSIILIPTAYNFDWYFAGIQDMKHNAIYNLLKTVIPAIVIFIFLKDTKYNIYLIPLAMVLGVLFGAIYHRVILYRKNLKIKFTMSKSKFKMYFAMGIPFLLSGLLAMVNGNFDKIILGANDEFNDLGVYQSAYNLVNFIIAFIGILFLTLFPVIVRSYRDRKAGILKTVSKIVFVIIIPISLGIFSLAEEIILLVFDSKRIGAVIPLKILMVYIFILGVREVYAYALNAFGMEKIYLKIVLISASANIILNIILTPKYGYIMAAVITTVTEVINLVLMRNSIRTVMKFNDFKEVGKVMIPALIMTGSIYILKEFTKSIFIIIPFAIIIYFAFIFGLKIININEIKETLRE